MAHCCQLFARVVCGGAAVADAVVHASLADATAGRTDGEAFLNLDAKVHDLHFYTAFPYQSPTLSKVQGTIQTRSSDSNVP